MAGLALFPIYLMEEGVELPKEGKYYLITKDGIYFHKETKAGSALVPVKGIPWLESPDVDIRLKLPKVPGRIIGQALTFFRKVFDKHESEAYVTLLYSSKLKQYRLWAPKQEVSKGSVNYDRTDQVPPDDRAYKMIGVGENRRENTNDSDWQMVGTIHSHCDFSAFHSGTDIGDEATFDGIHITLGHVNRRTFSMESSVAINDIREKLDPESCCTGVVRVANKQAAKSSWMSWDDGFYFDLELSEADAQGLIEDAEQIEKEWMPKVTKKEWGFFGSKKSKGNGGFLTGNGNWISTDDDFVDRDYDMRRNDTPDQQGGWKGIGY